jgi:glycosyltransferase involved in cell wall biosynthesis
VKQCFIIPVYRHSKTAGPLAEKLAGFGLPIIIVDDGNDPEGKKELEDIAAKIKQVVLVRLKKNYGKGKAVITGFKKAAELGMTHALQIDADGQHDVGEVPFFLEESAKNPDKLICAFPVYDASAPAHRVKGRKVSNFWAAVTTLSRECKEVLCGFRVYPVNEAIRATKHLFMDKHMGFDSEILVRLYWLKVFPVYHPVKVIYPKDGLSNFRMIKDNLHISWTFFRLSIGMLLRFPYLIILNIRRSGS